jgi:hypothetical protein
MKTLITFTGFLLLSLPLFGQNNLSVSDTGRGNTNEGAGDYPLSETETRAVVTFLLSHPNVYVVNSMDTRLPMHLRAPSTSPSSERMYPEDLNWYKLFDEIGKKITGYEKAGDIFNNLMGGYPLFGHGPDFGYWYFGAIWYGDKLWNNASTKITMAMALLMK